LFISVVIPTCNKSKFLDVTLASLSKQKLSKEDSFEIVVVNDGKEEETIKVVDSWKDKLDIKYCKTTGKSGRARARNLGAENANGEILIFLDDDMLVMPELINEHISAHSKQKNIVAIGYRYRLEQSTLELFNFITPVKVAANIEHIKYLPSLLDERETVYKMCDDNIEKYFTPWVCLFSNNMSIGRDIFIKHKFDEIYQKKWGVEDVDLGYRLYKAGIHFTLIRKASAYHLPHHTSWRKNLSELKENLVIFHNNFKEYEIELYADHLKVGLLKYMECIKNIKTMNYKISDSGIKSKVLEFYNENIKNKNKVFISGIEDLDVIDKLRLNNKSIAYSNFGGLIGARTEYADSHFEQVIIGSGTNKIIYPYMSLILKEALRISKSVLFVIDRNDLRNIFEFFSIGNIKDYKYELIKLLELFGINEQSFSISEDADIFSIKIDKQNGILKESNINISFSIDLEVPYEKTVSALEFAIALNKQGINVHIQNTEHFIKYDEINRSKVFANDDYLYEEEKAIVSKMLSNDLKLLSSNYHEIPIERLENYTPNIIGWSDGELVGFPLNEKIEFINNELGVLWHYSEYLMDFFIKQGGDKKKSFVVPVGVNHQVYKPVLKNNDKFIFMAMGSVFKESGIDIALEAFKSVFSNNDNAEFYVYIEPIRAVYERGFFQTEISYKQYMKYYEQYKELYYAKINKFKKLYEDTSSNIKIQFADLNSRKRVENYQECDVYMHLHRNDFQAGNVMKAMSCEKNVITVLHFFPDNLCTQENSFPVKANIESGCEHEYSTFSEYSLWAEPDIEDVKSKMLYAYQNKQISKQKAKKAREDIVTKWTWEHAAEKAVCSIKLKTEQEALSLPA